MCINNQQEPHWECVKCIRKYGNTYYDLDRKEEFDAIIRGYCTYVPPMVVIYALLERIPIGNYSCVVDDVVSTNEIWTDA
jgi:hypothetical protein